MNWHNLSEEQFDQRIKNHLDGSELPFDPASWDKMNKKLNSVFPGGQRGSILGLVLVSILLSSMFFWNVTNFSVNANSKTDIPIIHRESTEAVSSDNARNIQDENYHSSQAEHSPAVQSESNSGTEYDGPSGSSADQTKNISDKEVSGNQLQSGIIADEHLTSSLKQQNENNFETAGQQQTRANSESTSPLDEPSQNTFNQAAKATGISILSDVSQNNFIDNQAIAKAGSSGKFDSLGKISGKPTNLEFLYLEGFPDSVSQVISAEPPVIKQANSRWFVGFGYAPDISLVGFGETTSPGNNIGLSVEYQLSSRWSIQSGVTYSMKKYKAAGEDYHPPYGFWNYGDVPEETDAACDVIDIPINLKYYFSSNFKSRFYASTGLSSYLMLTEDYYYQYEGYPDPDAVESWHVSNENQHFFGVYNLAVGYQRSIGNQWYLEIEPFIKLPLGGVGFGKVDLWSTGSVFSIKYNFK